MTNPLEDFMGGGGARSFPFTQPGATVEGAISRLPEKKQQTDVDTGAPRVFKDSGEPMWVFVLELQTAYRDPADASDDGTRSLWLKGGEWDAQNQCGASLRAVQEAIKASGAKLPALGGKLTLQYVGDGPRKSPTKQPPKYYRAWYVPPATAGFMAAEAQPQYAAPAQPQYAAPAQPQYAAPAQPQYAAPAQPQYAAPAQPQYAAPAQPQYAAPAQPQYAAPAQPQYAAPAQPQYAAPAPQYAPPPPPPPPAQPTQEPQQSAVLASLQAQQRAAVERVAGQNAPPPSPNQSPGPAPF